MDIQQCLKILQSRSDFMGSENQGHDHAHQHDCGQTSNDIPKEELPQGQVIEMGSADKEGQQDVNESEEGVTLIESPVQEEALSTDELSPLNQKKLEDMTRVELLKSCLSIQQQRVRAFAEFDRVLEENIIQQGNLDGYPDLCRRTTRRFSQLSSIVRAVEEALKSNHRDIALANMVRRLQEKEKEKLLMTAALHLEVLRKKQADLSILSTEEEDKKTELEREAALLVEGAASYRTRLGALVGAINEVIEELRCELTELLTEEQEG